MSKTIKNCFYEKLTFDKMMEAHIRARNGKRTKAEVIIFEMDLETNIIKIVDDIKNNRYKFGQYREFKVYEPKERIIKSLPYRDRVVHQWFVEEFIKPYYYPRFINDTYACLDKRGTHICVKNLQKKIKKAKKEFGNNVYVLKTDIKKYFYSIDKSILIKILKKRIHDKKIIEFTKVILNDDGKIGIPIGNYTSQYFANIYLSELDYYVKNELHIKYYQRYMDDQIFILKNKEEAKKIFELVKIFVVEKLNLELNDKSKYFPIDKGIDFCGFIIFENQIKLRKRFKKKFNKNIKIWKKLSYENRFYEIKFILSYNSIIGHAKHADSINYINKMNEIIDTTIFNK